MRFRRQHPINKYVLDFYCFKKKLSIELDGKYHAEKAQQFYDEGRTKNLADLGIREIRFSNEEVMNDLINMRKTDIFISVTTPTFKSGARRLIMKFFNCAFCLSFCKPVTSNSDNSRSNGSKKPSTISNFLMPFFTKSFPISVLF